MPILVIINSLNKFTYYKFNYQLKQNNKYLSGKFLLLISLIISLITSILISQYIFINLKIILNYIINKNEYLVNFDIDKQILFLIMISTFLIFKRTKFIIKKIILINYFLFSIITWFSQINNSFLIDVVPFYIFNFRNINFTNIAFLLIIETFYYLWSYISYGSFLSDWKVPIPSKKEVSLVYIIGMFYLLIILYYSILFK